VKITRLILAFILALASLHAVARQSVPIINHENVAIERGTARALTADEVKAAILAAAAQGHWDVAESSPGVLKASLNVRNKHTAVVQISYSADKYSIIYRDSTNLNFKAEGSGPGIIHPFYNRWVQDLRDAIRLQLNKI